MEDLAERVGALEARKATVFEGDMGIAPLDEVTLLISAVLVFFMQAGFAMLEVGCIASKNTQAVLAKNIADASAGALIWWLFADGLAFGEGNAFIGRSDFLMNDRPLSLWLFNWAFAATSSTIVSGSVAERATVPAHCFGAMALIGVIYPVVVHWAWSADGWASPFKTSGDLLFGCGAIDFAGSTVVHAVGGTVALVGAVVVGPRLGRFIRLADGSSTVNRMPMQSPALHALGTLILWTGWFGFNGGTAATLDPTVVGIDNMVYVTSRAMLGTALAGAAGSIAVFVCLRVTDGKFDSMAGGNGILAGLVGITASAPLVSPLGAIIVGMVSGVVYVLSSRLLVHLRVDDVVEASPVHLFCGIVGTLMVGLFAEPNAVELAYGPQDESCCGLFYGCSGKLLAANTVFILSVIAWCVPLALVVFTCLRSLGILRVNRSVEKNGLDNVLVPKNDTVSDALKRALRRAGISATVGGLESIGSHNSRSISKSVTSSMHLG